MGVLVEGPAVRVLFCGSGFRDGQCGMPGRLTNNTIASFGHSQPTGRSFYAPNRLQNLQEQQGTRQQYTTKPAAAAAATETHLHTDHASTPSAMSIQACLFTHAALEDGRA